MNKQPDSDSNVTHCTRIGNTYAFVIRPEDKEYKLDEEDLMECSICHSTTVPLMWINEGGSGQYEDTLCLKCINKAFE